MSPVWQFAANVREVTPRELAAHLKIEANALATHGAEKGDAVVKASAQRLELLADAALALQSERVHSTLDGMTPARADLSLRRAKAKGFTHPFHSFLLKLKPPVSVNAAAARLGINREIARGWLRTMQVRTITEEMAKKIEKIYGYPATAKNWPNGIRKE